MAKIGINGFGSIGRRFYRAAQRNPNFEIVAVNHPKDPGTLAHLLKYDSNYGTLQDEVKATADRLTVGGRAIKVTAERDPADIPWKDLGVDVVLESTGRFTQKDKAALHLQAGAKKVIISAPGKGEDITIVLGVNNDKYNPAAHNIISNGSCTTNALAPVAKVLLEVFGIEQGLMTTIHAYTNDQGILDRTHKDLRRGRSATQSIIPTTTGAAKGVALVLPELKGKLNGMSFRVPVPTVSVVDLTVRLSKPATAEAINKAMEEYAAGPLKGILGITYAPLVSVDFKGMRESAMVDGLSTRVVDDMAKVVAWYDNEWGYCERLVDLVNLIVSKGL